MISEKRVVKQIEVPCISLADDFGPLVEICSGMNNSIPYRTAWMTCNRSVKSNYSNCLDIISTCFSIPTRLRERIYLKCDIGVAQMYRTLRADCSVWTLFTKPVCQNRSGKFCIYRTEYQWHITCIYTLHFLWRAFIHMCHFYEHKRCE